MKAKRIIALFLVAVMTLSLSYVFANSDLSKLSDNLDKEEEVLTRAKYFLERYWNAKEYTDYNSFKEEFLKEDNMLFNEEMRVRLNYDNLLVEDSKKSGTPYLGSYIHYAKDLKISRVENNIYTLTTKAEKIFKTKFDFDEETKECGTDLTDIILKFEVIEGKILLIDLIDRTSCYFNKDYGINGRKEIELSEEIPYTKSLDQNFAKEAKISLSKKDEKSLKEIQLKCIEKASEELEAKAKFSLVQ